MSRQYPTSFEAARAAVIAFLRSCDPHMAKLHDRQLLKTEIDRMRGATGMIGTGLKDTGISRSVDDLGRVVIPKELRDRMGFDPGTPVEFFTDKDAGVVYLQTYKMEKCAVCGDDYSLTPIKGKYLCENCISKLFEGVE